MRGLESSPSGLLEEDPDHGTKKLRIHTRECGGWEQDEKAEGGGRFLWAGST